LAGLSCCVARGYDGFGAAKRDFLETLLVPDSLDTVVLRASVLIVLPLRARAVVRHHSVASFTVENEGHETQNVVNALVLSLTLHLTKDLDVSRPRMDEKRREIVICHVFSS